MYVRHLKASGADATATAAAEGAGVAAAEEGGGGEISSAEEGSALDPDDPNTPLIA